MKKILWKCLKSIRIGTYQSVSEGSTWEYEMVSGLWSDIDPYSDYIDDGSSYEAGKYQDILDYQEQN